MHVIDQQNVVIMHSAWTLDPVSLMMIIYWNTHRCRARFIQFPCHSGSISYILIDQFYLKQNGLRSYSLKTSAHRRICFIFWVKLKIFHSAFDSVQNSDRHMPVATTEVLREHQTSINPCQPTACTLLVLLLYFIERMKRAPWIRRGHNMRISCI